MVRLPLVHKVKNHQKRLPEISREALILLYLLSEGSSARIAHKTTFSLNSRLRTH